MEEKFEELQLHAQVQDPHSTALQIFPSKGIISLDFNVVLFSASIL
jgi:hypothetical protein